MTRWSYWVNSKNSVSSRLFRSQSHYDLTDYTPRIPSLLHCYDHNATMISLSKLRPFCFYCIVTIKMPPWPHWIYSEHSVSTAFLRSQWHYGLTENTPNIHFLMHCYDQKGTMISLSENNAFCFYCIVTITMPRWSHLVNSEHSISSALLRSECHEDLTV
jgi:hypothetical protein